jgi:cysteine desulfurase
MREAAESAPDFRVEVAGKWRHAAFFAKLPCARLENAADLAQKAEMSDRIYFDHNATSPLRPVARAALLAGLEAGNASSIHAEGRAARSLIENARAKVAWGLGTTARLVTFTSGATEAANLALRPQGDGGRLLIGAGEHPCVLAGHGFAAENVELVPLDAQGRLDLDALAAALTQNAGRRVTLALQAVNNETGVVQPVAAAAVLVHAAGGIVVCDAVQAFGRIDCTFAAMGADLIFVSGHKLGGPKGVGALACASDKMRPAKALIRGGGQERNLRGGTENVAAIAGFAAATAETTAAREAEAQRLAEIRDYLQACLLKIAPEAAIFGAEAQRVANTLAFALPGLSAETLVAAFDVEGVALSSGSACSSGKVAPSHVLAAMGASESQSRSALRVSLGWNTSQEEGVRFLEIFARVYARMRSRQVRA